MREILFRGKKVDSVEWIYGNLINKIKPTEKEPIFWCSLIHDGALTAMEVVPETIGQFTGLTDKNGKEIFEGDILSIAGMVFNVIHSDGSFRLMFSNDKNRGQLYQERANKLEIIGNIHDKNIEP